MLHTLALGMPGPVEWIMIGGIALLIFGKRLPDVARSLGKGIVEFKKGLKGIEEEVEGSGAMPPAQGKSASPPKFDPYTGKPLDSNATPPGAG
jgi:sec-independent protein translocase protein TatA